MAASNTKPIVMFQMFKILPVPGHWSPSNKSLFEKINELVFLPNGDFTEHMHTIMNEYCLQKKWSQILIDSTDISDLLPSTDILINKMKQIQNIMDDNDNINIQLTNSIELLNVLAANYALYALQHLSSLRNTHLIIEDELLYHVRNDEPYFVWLFQAAFSLVRHHKLLDECGHPSLLMTNHSLQLIRKQILDQFPLLTSLLAVLNMNGLELGPILSGIQSVNDLFIKHTDGELLLADMLNIISSSKTHHIFQILIDHWCTIYAKCLRIVIVGSGTSLTALPILQQLIVFAEQTGIYVKLLYVDLTETLLREVEQAFQTILTQDQNKSQRVSVSYHVYDVQAEFDESNLPGK
jgi:hypothetical protein